MVIPGRGRPKIDTAQEGQKEKIERRGRVGGKGGTTKRSGEELPGWIESFRRPDSQMKRCQGGKKGAREP